MNRIVSILAATLAAIFFAGGCDSGERKRIETIKADTDAILQSIPERAAKITNWSKQREAVREIEAQEAEVERAISAASGDELKALRGKQVAIWRLRGAVAGLKTSDIEANKTAAEMRWKIEHLDEYAAPILNRPPPALNE